MTDFQITEAGEYASANGERWIVVGSYDGIWCGWLKDDACCCLSWKTDGCAIGAEEAMNLNRRILPEKTVWVVFWRDKLTDCNRASVLNSEADATYKASRIADRGDTVLCTREITIPDGGGE